MGTRSVLAFGVACFAIGAVVGVLATPRFDGPAAPPVRENAPDDRPVESAPNVPRSPSNGLVAEAELLRATLAMAESECTSRFAAAGCVRYIPWPEGTDPIGTARMLDEVLRACPNVDPKTVHVDCNEYPCGVAFVDTQYDDEWMHCEAFHDVALELSPGRGVGSSHRLAEGGRAHLRLFSPSFDASPEMVDAAVLHAEERFRVLDQDFKAKLGLDAWLK